MAAQAKGSRTTGRQMASRPGKRQADNHHPDKLVGFADFRERYESEYVSGLANRTAETIGSIFGIVERISNPQKLTDLTASRSRKWPPVAVWIITARFLPSLKTFRTPNPCPLSRFLTWDATGHSCSTG